MGIYHSYLKYLGSRVHSALFPQNFAEILHLIVQVEQGKLRGKESIAKYSRKKYCSFLGVPYAKPPVNDLRFMPPQPCEPWEGLYDATYERSICRQYDDILLLTLGDEDCLYMNIFTPKPPREIQNPLPVMLFVHGGGFNFGSGSRSNYGADHLINHDVILIVPNYRLNVFGFLNLGINECPGNVGMKDVVCCLQWAKKNIHNFGGDASNITLFGESAGATIARYLQISPLSQGLFSKVIIQSGCIPAPYYIHEDPIQKAFNFGAKVGYLGADALELVQHLRKLSYSKLFRIYQKSLKEKRNEMATKLYDMGPSTEYISEGAAIPPDFKKLAEHNPPMPSIYGCNPAEGAAYFILHKYCQKIIGKDCTKILTNNFKMNLELYSAVEKEVRKLYFDDKSIANNTCAELIKLLSDVFMYGMYNDIDSLINSQASTYLYSFNFFGRLNIVSVMMRIWYPWLSIVNNFKDACHGDELAYLFNIKLIPIYPPLRNEDKKMINLMTTMWTNFAKTGNPSTPDVEWKPATRKNMCHLLINEKPEMKPGNIMTSELFVRLHQLLDPIIEEI